MKNLLPIVAVTLFLPTLALPVFGIGWDMNDFIVSSAFRGVEVYDNDWSFKGYVDVCPETENCRITGLDFDADGYLVAAWAEDSVGETIRTYRSSDGSLVKKFGVPRGDNGVNELKVGPNGNIFLTKSRGPIREYSRQGELIQTFDDPAPKARRIGSSNITTSSGALAALPNGEIWTAEATQSPLAYVYAFDPADLNSAGHVYVGSAAPEELTEPVSVESVSLLRASSLQYLPNSDTVLALGYFRDIGEERFSVKVWEIAAGPSQLISIDLQSQESPNTREVQYRQLVNRYDSELGLNNTSGVTRGPNGDIYAVAFGESVHQWAYEGEYIGEHNLMAGNADTFSPSINILWTGNSPQFAVPEPESLYLLLAAFISLGTANRKGQSLL